MWIAIIAGWLLASGGLYFYLVRTAREPQREECMDCARSECTDCPYLAQPAALDRAA